MSHDMTMISARLRQAGFRVTPQRQLILDAVCKLGGHVTPESVYKQVRSITPAINRATVYRTLHFLTEQQILAEMALPNGRTGYEIASETPHHHLVCRQCGGAVEITDEMIRPLAAEIEAQYNFTLDIRHVTFWGLCAECREEK
ncbi:MAG TPA: transcriptional repressor [Anaerolineae bacterium]|nr:transcriptional repressor [Anaerolineae bacterium]HIP70204.1 transcriptional repressor [Anaerolineae bacterium]